MSFLQRAWLYITRKKLKTLILLAILLCMSTIMLSGFAIKHSTDAAAQSLDKTLKAGFTLGNNPRTNPGTARGSGTVSNKDIDTVKNLEGVTDYVKRQNATVDFINTKLVPLPSGGSGYDAEKDKQFGNAATIIGVNKSESEKKFRAESLKLIAGRHITENDSHKILVHEDFAKANNLKLGSKIKLKANQYDTDNEHPSKDEVEVEIVGIKEETRKVVVTGVEMFRKLLDEAQAGDNIGALLRGVQRDEIERGQVLCKPGSVTCHHKFTAQVYVLTKDEGGRHTPFFNNYRPQFYFRTTDVTGVCELPEGTEMCMPGDNVEMTIELIHPVAMEQGLRFAIREGGRTVGSGRVATIIE